MKKRLLIVIVFFMAGSYIFAQPGSTKIIPIEEKGISLSAAIHIPVGNFSSTHFIGLGIDCSPTLHRFGLLKRKKTSFTYNGGLAYYPGKKETVSSYPYKYPGYLFIHGFGGLLYSPAKNTGITLVAGPALGIYNGILKFNLGSKLEASYYINTHVAVGPGILFMKESGADPLWAATIKATLVIK